VVPRLKYVLIIRKHNLAKTVTYEYKAKVVPLHAMKALMERGYSSYSFSTSALDAGQPHAPAAF
jgi:hypothetical protein